MSLLTTVPEELAAAAAQLTAIVSSLTAQNAGAAPATTGLAPAAADPVSAQQAGIFSAYGNLYQQIAAEAQSIQEQFASTLGLSSGTYSSTEASNASQAAASGNVLNTLYGFLTSNNGLFSPSGGGTTIGLVEGGNFASAQSDDIGLITGTLSAVSAPSDAAAGLTGFSAADLAGTSAPAVVPGMGGMAGLGAMPMTGGMGSATMVGKLSVPPSWAGTVTTVSSVSPIGPQTGGWTAAAPQAGQGTIIPGMPGVGAAARNSAGFGAPRYGVKPLVMPKPTAV
ncbi:PE domain-containing protein [Mycobacterium sp.]|uniref:PPE family protein, SVP subgroup n=1 Tax=Mycobacterium sp. TaxID=1785 RepID=UPI0025D3A90B|nr:PE domain-containing protein [Mycobacterium sp.]MBW0014600.1 PE domain-containing protein [Mycobacterium sp.]